MHDGAGGLAQHGSAGEPRSCEGGAVLQLDLTDLVSTDVAGVDALVRLRARGATLVGVPGYIQLKLDSHQ